MADWYSLEEQRGGQGIGAPGGADLLDQLSRFLFIEEVLAGRRVLLVGGAAYALSRYLKELGARKVVCALFDAERVEQIRQQGAPEGVDVRLVRPGALPGDDGAFDLVVDFGLPFEDEPARELRLFEIERLLSDDGFALTALPSGEHGGLQGLFGEELPTPRVEYPTLAETLVDQFEVVEVYFQSLLLGYFFGSFEVEPGDEGIAPHTGLMGDEPEPATTWIFAFGNAVPLVQDVSLVQLPFAPLVEQVRKRLSGASTKEAEAPASSPAPPAPEEPAPVQPAPVQAEKGSNESADPELALRRAEGAREELELRLEERGRELEKLAGGVNRLMAEREGLKQRTGEAERRYEEARAELELSKQENEQLKERLRAQQASLETRGRELGKATERLSDVAAQRDTLQRVVAARDRELAEVKDELAQAVAERERLEEQANAADKAFAELAQENASVVERLRARVEGLVQAFEESEARSAELLHERDRERAEHTATRDELERATKELLVLAEDAERLERENVRMDRELSELRAQADLLGASLFEAQRAAEREAAEAAHVRAALEEAQERLVEERARGDRLLAELQAKKTAGGEPEPEPERSKTDAAER